MRIGFIGAGKMATALASGILQKEYVEKEGMIASDPYLPSREKFQAATNIETVEDNQKVVNDSSIVILAVKPQMMREVLSPLKSSWKEEQLILSIAAGVPLNQLRELIGTERKIVRVMPNTPALVGEGAACFSVVKGVTSEEIKVIENLLNCVGKAWQVEEKQMDAVTGLSGSGPAYIYLLIEALSDGGVLQGLPRSLATELAAQTVLGAAQMVLTTQLHPGELKDQVTSPGGTTINGIAKLEEIGLRNAMIQAVRAATERSKELGR
ncbi:Pyrroline-5-carboxylate reductase [Planctomycetales bacterium 10988]|nr:Pyrroline-5-carboxylate reductase [Planctomycetales bacterium 10988]